VAKQIPDTKGYVITCDDHTYDLLLTYDWRWKAPSHPGCTPYLKAAIEYFGDFANAG